MPFEMDSTISIHAPREGGDEQWWKLRNSWEISIHAPARGATLVSSLASYGL